MRRLWPWLPVLVVGLPVFVPWGLVVLRRERCGRRARGRRVLTPSMEIIVRRIAEQSITTEAAPVSWDDVVDNVDRYLDQREGSRRWRIPFGLLLLDVAPVLRTGRRLSRLGGEAARQALASRLDDPDAAWRPLARLRQLVRLAYYAHPSAQQWMGFVPVPLRGPAPRPVLVPSVPLLPTMGRLPAEARRA